mmetsp:Transcript_127807/g.367961  ORF Transcript_127807/g.367961 Transcript_127807/m.367961 type:complete len:235 (+) Transcript_127807:89-793(+)
MQLALFVALLLLSLGSLVSGARVQKPHAKEVTVTPSGLAQVDQASRRAVALGASAGAAGALRPDDMRWKRASAPAPALLDGPETRGEDDVEDEERDYDVDYDYIAELEAAELERQFADASLGILERRVNGTRHRCGQAGVEIVFDLNGAGLLDDQVLINGRSYMPLPHTRQRDPRQHALLLVPLGPQRSPGDSGAGSAYEVWLGSRTDHDHQPPVMLTRLREFVAEEDMLCLQA